MQFYHKDLIPIIPFRILISLFESCIKEARRIDETLTDPCVLFEYGKLIYEALKKHHIICDICSLENYLVNSKKAAGGLVYDPNTIFSWQNDEYLLSSFNDFHHSYAARGLLSGCITYDDIRSMERYVMDKIKEEK